ncbi:MAG: betaine--homocysteine S-methyltransferase [Alphaproteobacteria bacterium]|nr:betaine--homocysteine S-methyltransferase [Alphaproteobacteria bacterium]
MPNRFLDLLSEKPYLIADGATGTNLFALGLATGDAPELWCVEHPDRVAILHRSFVESGSDIILTNSFGGSRYRLKLHRSEHRVAELNQAAARIAREVAAAAGRPVVVAGSMGPTGELFEPLGTLNHADAVAAFAEQAQGLAEGGADVLWIETMSSEEEVAAAVEGAGRTGLPIVATMTFDTSGRSMMGVTPQKFAAFCRTLRPAPVAIGANCGVGPAELLHSVLGLTDDGLAPFAPGQPLIVAKGNCGVPQYLDGQIHYQGTPELMAKYARLARAAGARIIGGCCGSTAAHIAAILASLKDFEPLGRPNLAAVTADLGEPWSRPAVAGEAKSDAESSNSERGGRRRRRGAANRP